MKKSAIGMKKANPSVRIKLAYTDEEIRDRLIEKFGGNFLCEKGLLGHDHEINIHVEGGKCAIRMPGLTEPQAKRVLHILEQQLHELIAAGAANYDPGIVEY